MCQISIQFNNSIESHRVHRLQTDTFVKTMFSNLTFSDLTIAAHRLVSKIGDWCVLEVTDLSVHQCIEFSMQEQSHPVNTGKGGKGRSPYWAIKKNLWIFFRKYGFIRKIEPSHFKNETHHLNDCHSWNRNGYDGEASGGVDSTTVGENGLSENQFGFKKGRSTVDAIQAVFNIAINARKRTSALTYAIRSILRGGISTSRQ